MPEPWLPTLVTAVLGGLLAWALTGWMRRLAETESAWYGRGLHVVLATLGGAGAAVLGQTWAEVVTFAVAAVAGALLFTIDLAEERLPDAITLPMYPVLYAMLAVCALVADDWASFGRAALAGAIVLVLFFVLALIGPLYLGDVKLSGLIGGFLGWLGWSQVFLGIFAGFAIHALIGIALMVTKRADRKTEFAFGPWMILGAVIGAMFGPAVFPAFS